MGLNSLTIPTRVTTQPTDVTLPQQGPAGTPHGAEVARGHQEATQQLGHRFQIQPARALQPAPITAGMAEAAQPMDNSRILMPFRGTQVYMPTAGVSGENVGAKIQQFVREGEAIYTNILNGGYDGVQPHKQETAKLMWFLQALGSQNANTSNGSAQSGMFREGAFMIADPDGKLEAFLTQANSYDRKSSHMKEFQKCGSEFKHHGVDLRNVETPNERQTVLFARLPTHAEVAASPMNSTLPRGANDTRMLFVKMESHGCRGLSFKGSGTPIPDGESPNIGKGIKRFFLNAKDFMGHSLGFAKSLYQRFGGGTQPANNNKERLPSEVKTDYQTLIKFLKAVATQSSVTETPGGAESLQMLISTLELNGPKGTSTGINQMHEALGMALDQCAAYRTNHSLSDGVLGHIMREITETDTRITAGRSHLEQRIGNEVILMQDAMRAGV